MGRCHFWYQILKKVRERLHPEKFGTIDIPFRNTDSKSIIPEAPNPEIIRPAIATATVGEIPLNKTDLMQSDFDVCRGTARVNSH